MEKKKQEQEEHEQMIADMRRRDAFEAKLERWRTLTSLARFFGSMVITIDNCLKIYYLQKSRFTNPYIRDIYKAFLLLKPVSIVLLLIYNYLLEKRELDEFL